MSPPIVRLHTSEITPGSLGQRFRNGAAAVIISGDPAVSELWQRLMSEPGSMPWASTLYQLSANLWPHKDLTEALGDVYYFKPGRHSYIGRKIEIMANGQVFVVRPGSFRQGDGDQAMAVDLVEKCWHFCNAILQSLKPMTTDPTATDKAVRVVVQRLKYDKSQANQEALFAMVRNSLGPWARIGYGLDRRREEMRGALGRRGVSDVLALLELMPFLRLPIRWLNGVAARFDSRGNVPEGTSLLVKAHIDTRYFSALCGTRENLQTEILVDDQWLPLPLNRDDVAVLPGSIAMKTFGIKATVHRVLQTHGESDEPGDPMLRNVTLLLGAK